MRAAYAWQTKHLRTGNKPYEGSLHLAIKKRFQLDDYYANSAVQQANALRTSQKELQVLYMKQMHISIHQAASYVIGRRGMNLKEQVPKVLRAYTERKDGEHHWKQWSVLTRRFKALRPHLFYHVSDQFDPLFSKEICAYGLTQVERDVFAEVCTKSLVRRNRNLTSFGMA
ncbi:hypothetical protein GCM10020331_000250 [Ectobacillus funiculus]